MNHLHSNRWYQVHFWYSHVRLWRSSFISSFQVLMVKSVSSTSSCIISGKKSMKTLSGEEFFFLWDILFCLNPLGYPVNLFTTGVESSDYLVSVQSLKPASVLSFSTVSLSLWGKVMFGRFGSQKSESKFSSSAVSSSWSLHCKATLGTCTQKEEQQTMSQTLTLATNSVLNLEFLECLHNAVREIKEAW